MKISFDIDATPQELRSFFGWPDVEPLQKDMLDLIRRNMTAGVEGFDPMALMKPWLPQFQSMDALQRRFWDAYLQQAGGAMAPDPARAEESR